jgi:23S rRNA (cytidine1920-2'-O)/16S rRNA (cytidine1409-2'-O)-methyltransferase
MTKPRLDDLLVERGLAETRSKAQALIMAGRVRVEGKENPKAGMRLDSGIAIEVTGGARWVGRGGEKLEGALEDLGLTAPLAGVWLDCGASTGGFTEVLLARGAGRVYAVDVGYGQLDARLRNDPRVVVVERFNIRKITREVVPDLLDGVTLDLSFISSRLVLPLLPPYLKPDAPVVLLFKPQFEAEKGEVGKGGIIRDATQRDAILGRFASWAEENGWRIAARALSRLKGRDGNQEVFLLLVESAVVK